MLSEFRVISQKNNKRYFSATLSLWKFMKPVFVLYETDSVLLCVMQYHARI